MRALRRSVSGANAHVRVEHGLRVRARKAVGAGWNARLSRANPSALERELRLRMRLSGGREILRSYKVGTLWHLISIRRLMKRCDFSLKKNISSMPVLFPERAVTKSFWVCI